jgi:hypothetical protein
MADVAISKNLFAGILRMTAQVAVFTGRINRVKGGKRDAFASNDRRRAP